MFKLSRQSSFWSQPWFLVIAIVAGQVYGGWWMGLAENEPRYVPSRMVVATYTGGFEVTITAPGIPRMDRIHAAN